MITSTIIATSYALPVNRLTQAELIKRFGEKAVNSIAKMSGINERRVVAPGQCASDLALSAANRLIKHHNIDRKTIDLLTFASQTPDYKIPSTASVLHGKLKLSEGCCTFDINQACSSFIHSLQVAHSMIVAGTATRALVINGDAISTLINPEDRGLVTLHGDAAAATLIEKSDINDGGFELIETGTDGSLFDRLLVPAGGSRLPSSHETKIEETSEDGCTRNMEQLYMDGPSVFHFAVYKIPGVIREAINKAGFDMDDIDMVLLHQANKMMVDLIYSSLKVPEEKRFYFLEKVGNSSGASLPTLLSHAWREGVIRPGSRTLLCGFGAGLSWGVSIIRWPDDINASVPGLVDVMPNKNDKKV
jgi:3-oxoacyl-[acyl-carrier-protein] synthase III